jgi:Tfp pilus assembly protein PilV
MLRRILTDEQGMTLTEVMVAGILTSIVVTAFYSLFYGFTRNLTLEEQRATALQEIRPVVSELIVELRQAQDIDNDGAILTALNAAWSNAGLVFYSDRRSEEGPERYVYKVNGCSGDVCDFVREVTLADAGTGPTWTYTGPTTTHVLLDNLLKDGSEPLFRGVSWAAGVEQYTTFCGAGIPCDFPLVRIRIRVDPDPDSTTIPAVQIQEDVRLRNS